MQPWLQSEHRIGDYLCRITLAEIAGRHEVVGVELWGIDIPADPHWQRWGARLETETPITTSALRIPLQKIVTDILTDLQRRDIDTGDLPGSARGRKVTRTDEHWRAVLELLNATPRGHRLAAICERWSVSQSTAAKWSARARALGQ